MRRSFLVAGAVAAAVVAIGGVAGGVAVAQAGNSHAVHEPRTGSFTVVEHAITDTTTDTSKKGDSVGDILTFANPVYGHRNKHRVGSDNGSCIRTVVAKAYECSWTTTLSGGSLVVEGPFYDHRDSVLAVTGGTGRWAQARGQMRLHARNAKSTSYDFEFHVTK